MNTKRTRLLAKLTGRALAIPMMMMVFMAAYSSGNLPDNAGEKKESKKGVASFYHNSFSGRKTASGEIFSQEKFTCASNHYPLGTWLRVTNTKNGKSVIVKVNDRMSPRINRVCDLTLQAAEKLGMIKSGLAKVEVENLGKVPPKSILN